MMQTHVLLQQPLDLGVNGGLVHWVKGFLSQCPQRLCVKGALSDEVILNTGAPQGCILSLVLFSV